MKLKNIVLLSLFMLSATFLTAQEFYFNMNYSMAAPLGETKDFIDKYSWRGVNIEGQWMMNPNLSVGYNLGWNVMNQKITGEFTDGTKTLSGTQLRYLNSFPIIIEGRYHIGESIYDGAVTPYVGAGIGTIYNMQRTEMGIFIVEDKKWQFGVVPAAGVLIPVGYSSMVNVGVKYNYAFKAGDMIAHSFLTINVGYVWGR